MLLKLAAETTANVALLAHGAMALLRGVREQLVNL